jgi:hypothetical protein
MGNVKGMQPPESGRYGRPFVGILEGDRFFEHVAEGYFQTL